MQRSILYAVCCLVLFSLEAFAYGPCEQHDLIVARVEDSDLHLIHYWATYNCCPDYFAFTSEIVGQTLFVTEEEVLTMGCSCLCCYTLEAIVEGLAPGHWEVVYQWYGGTEYLNVVIEDGAKSSPILSGQMESSGCQTVEVPESGTQAVSLRSNYPNPFNPGTMIPFHADGTQAVDLLVFDSAGHLVRNLMRGEVAQQGLNEIYWNGRDDSGRQLASGTYFYRLVAGDFTETRKMVMMK